MLVSSIKMSIENMHQYVGHMSVVLPNDKKKDNKEEVSVREQLGSIDSHIADLEVVRNRVRNSEMADNYLNPMRTENTGP